MGLRYAGHFEDTHSGKIKTWALANRGARSSAESEEVDIVIDFA